MDHQSLFFQIQKTSHEAIIDISQILSKKFSLSSSMFLADEILKSIYILFFVYDSTELEREINNFSEFITLHSLNTFQIIKKYSVSSTSDKFITTFQFKDDLIIMLPRLPIEYFSLDFQFLFASENLDKSEYSNLEKDLFEFDWMTLLTKLGSYNWSIDEFVNFRQFNDQIRNNNNSSIVTPEILGYHYEHFSLLLNHLSGINKNSEKKENTQINFDNIDLLNLSDKKSMGAYYTPFQITDYIVKSSINSYFNNLKIEIPNIRNSDFNLSKKDQKTLKEIIKILHDIKILDPASGSGQFLLVIAQNLYNLLQELNQALSGTRFDALTLKRKIIEDNIFGVDLMEGGNTITKLRLWLWTISGTKQIEIQKNRTSTMVINYNLQKGNTLFGEISTNSKKSKFRYNSDQFDWNKEFQKVFSNSDDQGFDIIVGNPPYVDHKTLKEIRPILKENYKVYSSTADLYVYFYERGVKLLNSNGVLGYITSNQFLKTNYGKKLKEYLSYKTSIVQFIDFGQYPVFDKLTISTLILIVSKYTKSDTEKKALIYQFPNKFSLNNLTPEFIQKHGYYKSQANFKNDPWIISKFDLLKIKHQIDKVSKNIDEVQSIQVQRGVTTGRNDVFIINNETKEVLTEGEDNWIEIVKPCIQGRNIKKNKIVWNQEWMILSLQGTDIDKYPAIKTYLENQRSYLEPKPEDFDHFRNKAEWHGRKPGTYNWYEIQDTTKFHHLFEREKIVWGLTSHRWGFAIDLDSYYLPSNGYIMVSDTISLDYLVALLNSSLVEFYFSLIGTMTAGGAYTLKHTTILKLPIIIPNKKNKEIVDKILHLSKTINNEPNSLQYEELNILIFDLYSLNESQIEDIERFLDDFRQKYGKQGI